MPEKNKSNIQSSKHNPDEGQAAETLSEVQNNLIGFFDTLIKMDLEQQLTKGGLLSMSTT